MYYRRSNLLKTRYDERTRAVLLPHVGRIIVGKTDLGETVQSIKLIDDQYVTLREIEDLTVRYKRIVEAAAIAATGPLTKLAPYEDNLADAPIAQLGLTAQEARDLFALQDATIVASLVSWTLDKPLPTLDTVQDLEPELYEALSTATQSLGVQVVNSDVDFEPPDPKSPEFQSSPTDASTASGSDSQAQGQSGSIKKRAKSGKSSSSAKSSAV